MATSYPVSTAHQDLYTEQHWYAGCTASRHEKRVAEQLQERGVQHFLPLYETIHRWQNGRHRVQLPLFPGYVFVRLALRDRLQAMQIPGFVRLVGFSSTPAPLPDAEIDALQQAFVLGVQAQPYPYLTAGRKVEIVRGPLQGISGVLLRRHGPCRVVLSVELILRSIVVEVNADDVTPVRSARMASGNSSPWAQDGKDHRLSPNL